jgi:hypothetical protein
MQNEKNRLGEMEFVERAEEDFILPLKIERCFER